MVETAATPKDYGGLFDTISVCLSKGLGAPVGSVLVGTIKHMEKALRIRKIFGGGMRQAGFLAAAGIYAIDHQWARLKEDHRKAKELGEALRKLLQVDFVEEVETNIVIFQLKPQEDISAFIQLLQKNEILISNMGQGKLRMVTHLDSTDAMHGNVLEVLKNI
jgi:threonine aldolase